MQIGSPLFDSITISLNPKYYKGKEFIIRTVNNSKDHLYIQKASLNDQLQTSPFLKFSDIVNGGTLILEMSKEPNKAWLK